MATNLKDIKIKIESIDDILELKPDQLSTAEVRTAIAQIRRFFKEVSFKQKVAEKNVEDLPYEGVAVVDKTLYSLRFNPVTKQAFVTSEERFDQDVYNNIMATYHGANRLKKLAKEQK